jgi:hypothetical protein
MEDAPNSPAVTRPLARSQYGCRRRLLPHHRVGHSRESRQPRSADISLSGNGVHHGQREHGSTNLDITVDTAVPLAPTGLDLAAVDDTFGAGTVGTCDNITRNTSALTISGSGENKRRSRCSTMSTTTAFGWRRGDAGYGDGAGNLPASCEGVPDRFGWDVSTARQISISLTPPDLRSQQPARPSAQAAAASSTSTARAKRAASFRWSRAQPRSDQRP